MLDGQKEEADQRLFEISLIGKTREEIERLTLARLWDKQIAAAQKEGVPSDVLANLNQGKADSMGLLSETQRKRRESDNDWQAGLKDGIAEYIESFGSMREQMENATVQTFEKMGDALAEFVATGKLDFRSLTVSILQDLSKMMIKMAIVQAMKAAVGSVSTARRPQSRRRGGGGTAAVAWVCRRRCGRRAVTCAVRREACRRVDGQSDGQCRKRRRRYRAAGAAGCGSGYARSDAANCDVGNRRQLAHRQH